MVLWVSGLLPILDELDGIKWGRRRCCRCALLGALTVVLLITLWIVGD
jgi:hypothetical protein